MNHMHRLILTALLMILVAGQALSQQVTWKDWGKATADNLVAFMPEGISGLIDWMPWDRKDSNKPISKVAPGEWVSYTFCLIRVERDWRISDPSLVKEYEDLDRQGQALLKRSEELAKTDKKEFMKLLGEIGKLTEKKNELTFKARYLTFFIDANMPPQEWFGVGVKPIGTMQGFPVYRSSGRDVVKLGVYLGPEGFRNPILKQGEQIRAELKSILVHVWVNPADEALAKQMLEKVDYEGLSKLIKR